MGVPRFGELIRRKYPKCWFQEGKANVFTSTPGILDLSVDGTSKRREVDTLFVDGNGLLHPAMQFTFGYGSFEDAKRQEDNLMKSEEQLITDGTRYFMNAIESLCLEFQPQRLVLAIDGSAPVAKMIQQRQRRFGAKINVSNDPALSQAWETTLRRSVRNSLQEEGSFVSVTVEFDGGRRDFGEGLINARLELLQPGTPQEKIFRGLHDNLIKGLGQTEKVRWYNVLSPETPLGFQYEGRWWYSVAMCASALAWREVWKQNTYISMFGLESEPEIGINRNNKYIYGTGKITTSEESPIYRYVEEFRRFRMNNSDFFVKFSSKIGAICEKIGDYLCEVSHVYRETLLMTGIGTNLERADGKRIEWLMNVRAKLVQRLEREISEGGAPSSSTKRASEVVDYPDYEGGFRGVEGILQLSKFDSNCLTPGTEIMNLIDKNIQRRFKDGKMELSNGRSVEVLYSSHRVAGEGEHKLENLIDREQRDMNGKVSLVYGLDADLFMLSLVRDYPICMVRENSMRTEKFFGKVPERRSPKTSTCHVVDIDRLKKLLTDVEETGRLVHPMDFTFVCFLFGNDFLRNVPGFIFDSRMQVVFDNKQTKNDEEVNPVLFDYVFDVYSEVRKARKLRNDQPLFITPSADIIKIRWLHVYEFLDQLSKAEKNILGGLIRRMQLEEEKEKLMTEKVDDYVPVNLRYGLLKKSIVERQVIKGGVIDQKAEWIRGIDAFDMATFERLWTSHITANIPGFDEDGVARGLSKSKDDVLEQICHRYMEGMEWAMKYYTNRHSFIDRSGMRKSNLDTRWYYPYFHAPMISQLKTHLWKQLMVDSRRLFAMTEETTTPLEAQLMVLFSTLRYKEITQGIKASVSKYEKDILDLLPVDYFTKPTSRPALSEVVVEQITNHLQSIRKSLKDKTTKIPSEPQYSYLVKRFKTEPFKFEYLGDNAFSHRWVTPTAIYGGGKETTPLIAPSSTNYKVQLLAVLPQQSHRLFPDGIQPSDPRIAWMYPKGIPIDFTFRDRVHASILMIPPPNLVVLEEHIKTVRLEEALEQVREGMFPREVQEPAINQQALKKVSYFDSIGYVISTVIRDLNMGSLSEAVDVLGGVGISSMALSESFDKVYVYEPSRENFADLKKNIDQFPPSREKVREVKNSYFQPSTDYRGADMVFIDLPYEVRGGDRNDKTIRIPLNRNDREGTPIEGFVEDLIEKFKADGSRDQLAIIIKVPQFKKLKRIVSDLKVKTKFIKDTIKDLKFTYALITVEKGARRARDVDYAAYDHYQSDPYGEALAEQGPYRDRDDDRYGYGGRRSDSPVRDLSPPRGRDRDRDDDRYGYGGRRSDSPVRDLSPPRRSYRDRDDDR